jgi:hypothetical protein
MPAIWLKTSRGFRARASLPLQRTARDKRHHGSLHDPDRCVLLNSFLTRSNCEILFLFESRLQLRSRPKRFLRCCLRRSELNEPEIANRSVEHCLGSLNFDGCGCGLDRLSELDFAAPRRLRFSCRLRSQAFRSTSSTSRQRKTAISSIWLRTKERYSGITSRLQTTAPCRHYFHSSVTPPHAQDTRETLRVDLAQTGAAPIRLSNAAPLWITLQVSVRAGIPMLLQQTDLNSTALLDR